MFLEIFEAICRNYSNDLCNFNNLNAILGRGRYRSSYGRSYGRRSYGKREAEQMLDENQVTIRK